MNHYILDTHALMSYFLAQRNGDIVREILRKGKDSQAEISMSVVNLGEVYYMLYKKASPDKALLAWRNIPRYPITLYPVDKIRTLAAAQIKAQYSRNKQPLSYADCFAAALAQELKGTLVTGDPEFQSLTSLISIQFLQRV